MFVICATGCDIYTAVDYHFPYDFDAVYCFIPKYGEVWVKDTTICFSREELQLLTLLDGGDGRKYGQLTVGSGDIARQFDLWKCDTVSFFIFDKGIVDNHPWDYIVKNYCVLQRYDFSEDDLARINCQISYPPTKEMANMHMFPPYDE